MTGIINRRAGSRPASTRRLSGLGLLLAVGLAVAGCSGGGATEGLQEGFVSGDGTLTTVPVAERVQAPDITGPTVGGDGAEISLADYRGQVVVLNVWASWCPPCRAEATDLVSASEQTGDIAQFVGLNAKEDNPAAEQAYLRAFEVPYPSLDDPSGELQLSFAGTLPPAAIPSTLVIDAEGRIAARALGTITETTLVDLVTDVSEGR